MGYDNSPDADLCILVDFNALRMFIIEVNLFANEYSGADFHTSEPMQERPYGLRSRAEACQKTQKPISDSSKNRFFQADFVFMTLWQDLRRINVASF